MAYDVDAIRNRLKQQVSGKYNDSDEFKPAKAENNESLKYRFFVLPPIKKGDKIKSGIAEQSMENFYVQHGDHWVQNRPHPCPRTWNNEKCELCQIGFDMLKTEKDEDKRRAIVKAWMPTTFYTVNIYFPNISVNPEELRGTVKYYKGSKTCCDKWIAAILRTDCGLADDPQAYGVFYDENAAFMFQLEAEKQGKSNSYKSSKFIHNGGKPVPIGTPDDIVKILEARIDIFSKITVPKPDAVAKLASSILNGDDGSGFNMDETKASAPAKAEVKSEVKVESKTETSDKPKAKVPDPDIDEISRMLEGFNS